MTEAEQIAAGLSEIEREAVKSIPHVRGARNGMFWANNSADLLANLSHKGLCKTPFADSTGHCAWQFVARVRPLGLAVRAILDRA